LADYFCTSHGIQITDNHLPTKENDMCYTLIQSKDTRKKNDKERFKAKQTYNGIFLFSFS